MRRPPADTRSDAPRPATRKLAVQRTCDANRRGLRAAASHSGRRTERTVETCESPASQSGRRARRAAATCESPGSHLDNPRCDLSRYPIFLEENSVRGEGRHGCIDLRCELLASGEPSDSNSGDLRREPPRRASRPRRSRATVATSRGDERRTGLRQKVGDADFEGIGKRY